MGVTDRHGDLVELYEGKTNSERLSIYTAIGRLAVHSSDERE